MSISNVLRFFLVASLSSEPLFFLDLGILCFLFLFAFWTANTGFNPQLPFDVYVLVVSYKISLN